MATFVVWICSASFPGGKEVEAASLQFFGPGFEVFLLAQELVY